jgi:hypothetical protein
MQWRGDHLHQSKLTYGRCSQQLHQNPAFVGKGSGDATNLTVGMLGHVGCKVRPPVNNRLDRSG